MSYSTKDHQGTKPENLKGAFDELSSSMEKTIELLGFLAELSDQKASCLTAGDIEGLRGAMDNEEEIIAALNESEKERMIKADALSQAIGLFGKNIRLKDLASALTDKAQTVQLTQLGERLNAAVGVLTEKNGMLKELLQLQVSCNDYMLNMLVMPKRSNNAYDIRGSVRDHNANRGFLDVHI